MKFCQEKKKGNVILASCMVSFLNQSYIHFVNAIKKITFVS